MDIDYKRLLSKYMARVIDSEGTDYIDAPSAYDTRDIFTKDERTELKKLSEELMQLPTLRELR